jgi:hypothetical protein
VTPVIQRLTHAAGAAFRRVIAFALLLAGCADPAAEHARQDARIAILGEALYGYAYCYRRVPHDDDCPWTLEQVARDRAAYVARYGSDPFAQ